jgi:Mn2+/Fe2+ NRAMP family transporter
MRWKYIGTILISLLVLSIVIVVCSREDALIIELFVLYLTGVIAVGSAAVFLVLLPLNLVFLKILKPSLRRTIKPYLIASCIGVSVAASLSFLSAHFSAREFSKNGSQMIAGAAYEELVARKTNKQVTEQFLQQAVNLCRSAEQIETAGNFVDFFFSLAAPALLLPPLILYALKGRKKCASVLKEGT